MLDNLQQSFNRRRDVFVHWCQLVLQRKLSRRSKRIIFVAAIAGSLENTDTLSDESLVKLNAVLKLTSSEDALKLPVYLNEAIWRGRSLDGLTVLEEIGTDIVKWAEATVPFWLRYGRASDMVSDAIVVKRLVEGHWSDDAVRLAKRGFRGFVPSSQASSFEPAHV
jgi:hypothetical protein